MSRIGREPVAVPSGVKVNIDDRAIQVDGKLGKLEYRLPGGIDASVTDSSILLKRQDDSRQQKALHGLARTLVANMIKGVTEGYAKNLEIVGVGYRCELIGKALQLSVGYSHKVVFIPPDNIQFKVAEPTKFSVSGINKELVGDVAAKVRAIRPPEPYKGKGIRYVGEKVRRKAGKTAGK